MVDEFKQSKKCIYLPNTSPIMRALDANGSESNGSLDSEDNNGIRYPETQKQNVFQIRVFNGDLHETKNEAANSMLKKKYKDTLKSKMSKQLSNKFLDAIAGIKRKESQNFAMS